MVLSCSDLFAVVTYNSGILPFLISWLREDYDVLLALRKYVDFVTVFLGFSFDVLLIMSIERYLGAYYPIFHHTSITRRRLLTLLTVVLVVNSTLKMISTNDNIIPRTIVLVIFLIVVFLPLAYLNFRLFQISTEVRRRIATLSEKRTTVNLKSISTCLLVVACLVVLSTPTIVYIVFNIITENRQAFNVMLSGIWTATICTMNCTLNSLIFFWKNKVLRTEGIKILKTLKDRLVKS